jgi:hypothetical protein
MTVALASRKCANHLSREAAGRCVGCRRTYCKECLTLLEGRLMCARCEPAMAQPSPLARPLKWTAIPAALIGFLLAWLVFYYTGAMLHWLPTLFPS